MQVTTIISKIDLIRFNLAILPKMRSTYITILFFALLALGIICWKNGVPQAANDWVATLVTSSIGGIVCMLFGIVISLIFTLFMSTSKNGIFGEHQYILSPKGLHEKTSTSEGLIKWKGITKVKVAGPYLLFQISSYLFHIVPVRSFESRESFNKFVSTSIEYWEDAHKKRVN